MTEITENNFASEIEEHKGLCVIDLWAPWCGPCRMLAPTIDALEKEYPDVKFCKINVDEAPSLAVKFHVESIPFVAFVKDNVFSDFSVGYVPKDKLAKMIEEYK